MSETEFRLRFEETPATEAGIELPSEETAATEAESELPSEDPPTEDIPAPESKFRLVSEETSEEVAVPEAEEAAVPEAAAPEAAAPEAAAPEASVPEAAVPEAAAPEAAAPEASVPEAAVPEAAVPEFVPETSAPETPTPETSSGLGPAGLGPEKRTCSSCNQENEIVREFCWACFAKLGDQGAGNGAAPQPEPSIPPAQDYPQASDIPQEPEIPQVEDIPQPQETPPAQDMTSAPDVPAPQSSPPETVRPEETSPGEDVLVDYGPSVKLAYRPSGEMGKTLTLLIHGATGVLVGLFKAALVLAAAVGVNLVHNLLPVFFFVLPLVIVGLMLIAPGVVGMAVGDHVSKGIQGSKCRVPAQAGFIALLSTLSGLALFALIAQSFTTPGESFLYDKLLWFVRLMVGGSVSFDWLAEPEPIGSAYEGIIFVLLGLSAVVGAGLGYHTASDTVRSVPFCEGCGKHMEPESLWSIPPVKGPLAVQAFQSMDYEAIGQIPHCKMVENFISVEVWSCTCESKSILELVGYGVEPPKEDGDEPTIQSPVRIFSRPLSPEQLSQIKA